MDIVSSVWLVHGAFFLATLMPFFSLVVIYVLATIPARLGIIVGNNDIILFVPFFKCFPWDHSCLLFYYYRGGVDFIPQFVS